MQDTKTPPTPETERVEIRAYMGKVKPVPALVVRFTIPRSANGSTPETSAKYRALARQCDGVEYVADVDGPDEELTDWDGMCPAEIRYRDARVWAEDSN